MSSVSAAEASGAIKPSKIMVASMVASVVLVFIESVPSFLLFALIELCIKNYESRIQTFLFEDNVKITCEHLRVEVATCLSYVKRIREGKKQSIETLINEEASLLASYLRNEKKEWRPRIGITV